MTHWYQQHEEGLSIGDQVADFITNYIGAWVSVFLHTVLFLVWFIARWDINLLTLIVSLEAIYLCLFLQKSSNLHSARDRTQAQSDYDTNSAAKAEIEDLQTAFARLDRKLDALLSTRRPE